MAITLEVNYAKKLGLPGYSSHQYSITVRTELTDLSQVQTESSRLYQLLQEAVDKDIQEVGFIPPDNYGNNGQPQQNGRTYHLNGSSGPQNGSNGHTRTNVVWNCTEGQRGLILRIINEHQMNKQDVEDLSRQLFGVGVLEINRMQASQLIEDLLVKAGQPARQTRWQKPQTRQAA